VPRVVKKSGSPRNLEINEPVSTSAADTSGVIRFDGLHYIYNLSGKALADPSASYRLEIALPNGASTTWPFGLRRS
jgi:hypothetical protein